MNDHPLDPNEAQPPGSDCFETGSIPGVTGQDERGRVRRKLKLPPLSELNFEPEQLQFSFVTALWPTPVAATKKRSSSIKVGCSYTNLFHPACRRFVSYLYVDRRRVYFCGCGNVLLGTRDPLNFRDPTLSEWEREVAGWSGRPLSYPFSRN